MPVRSGFEVFQHHKKGEGKKRDYWRWRLTDGTGRVVAESAWEYDSRDDAVQGVEDVRLAVAGAETGIVESV